MPFFPDKLPPQPSKQHVRWAERLHDIVINSGKAITRRWSRKAWANQFAILERDLGSADQISKVLDWYAKHIGQEWVPDVQSGKSFRLKFVSLQNAVARWEKDNPQITISPEAKRLVAQLRNYHWPKGSAKDLEVVIQQSIDFMISFRRKVVKYQATLKGLTSREIGLRGFCTFVLARTDPTTFVQRYLENVFKSVKNWKTWSGDLKQYTISFDRKLFHAQGRAWAVEYGSIDRWSQLVEVIHGK